MTYEEWMDEIDLNDLPTRLREVAEIIGLRNTLKLAQKYQGIPLYLNMLDSAIAEARNRRIRKEFNGSNHRQLAQKYRLTEVWIRQLLKEHEIDDNQICLFEDGAK